MKTIKINNNSAGQRLNKFLGRYLNAAPQSFIYKMLRKKNIKYNGGKADGSEVLSDGDIIDIYLSDETIAKFRKKLSSDIHVKSENDLNEVNIDSDMKDLAVDSVVSYGDSIPLTDVSADKVINNTVSDSPLNNIEIIYEDNDILILNKPVGMLSQKARIDDHSLNERIVSYYHRRDMNDELFTPSVCNRLDRNTSGIILAGMSYQGTRILSQMLKDRTIKKYYLTIVKGNVQKASTIKGYLTKKETHNQVIVYSDSEQAKKAGVDNPAYIETGYIPLKHGQLSDGKKNYAVTLLKVELITGKTHQIRAHLKSIGHPILGDGKYGHKDINAYMRKEFSLTHQLLHAYEIHFPYDVEKLSPELSDSVFRADMPEEFQKICDVLF